MTYTFLLAPLRSPAPGLRRLSLLGRFGQTARRRDRGPGLRDPSRGLGRVSPLVSPQNSRDLWSSGLLNVPLKTWKPGADKKCFVSDGKHHPTSTQRMKSFPWTKDKGDLPNPQNRPSHYCTNPCKNDEKMKMSKSQRCFGEYDDKIMINSDACPWYLLILFLCTLVGCF